MSNGSKMFVVLTIENGEELYNRVCFFFVWFVFLAVSGIINNRGKELSNVSFKNLRSGDSKSLLKTF